MNNSLFIRGPKQRRAIESLLRHESITTKDMGPIIGALNPRQTIMLLRRQGFHELIQTRSFEVLGRDGKICRPGEYYIPSHLKPLVEEALKKHVTQASANAKVTTGQNHDKPNHNKGEAA